MAAEIPSGPREEDVGHTVGSTKFCCGLFIYPELQSRWADVFSLGTAEMS